MQTSYTGTFEAHITVNATDNCDREKFRCLCQTLGVKYVLIELPQGVVRSQPMTASHHRGTLHRVKQQMQSLAQQFQQAGFEVTRIKIEAMVNNQDIPLTDAQAQALPETNYFEFHLKVTLAAEENLEAIAKLCQQYNAHLSANAFKNCSEGKQVRFITMRLYGVGLHSARLDFGVLLTALKAKGLKISQPQQEYTVFDSNINIDAGWFNTSNK